MMANATIFQGKYGLRVNCGTRQYHAHQPVPALAI